jgi:hypothetical protein
MGQFYELVRQAHPSTWADLRGDALLAMDYPPAAEILLRTLEDLGRKDRDWAQHQSVHCRRSRV